MGLLSHPSRTAKAITAGAEHACVLLDDGSIKRWGPNSSGQLGLGDATSRGDAAGEMGDALPPVLFMNAQDALQKVSDSTQKVRDSPDRGPCSSAERARYIRRLHDPAALA